MATSQTNNNTTSTAASGMEFPVKNLLGALAAGTAAGVYLTGASATDVATSMDGALGATVGLAVAPFVVTMPSLGLGPDTMQYAMLASGVALPALVAMKLDMPIVAIGAAAAAGFIAVDKFMA